MRSKAFFINGGAGRVICSIPALEKYAEENPDDDFVIVAEGGTDFFRGHPKLDGRVYDNWHKNLFEDYLKDRDCVSPEPYRMWHYYNQKCSLSQAYDMEINGLEEPRELPKPTVILNKTEVINGYNIVQEIKSVTGKDKVVVIQPFGRSIETQGDFIADPSSRSMSLVNAVDIINQLKKDYAVVIMSEVQFPVEENEEKSPYKIARPQIESIRNWAAVIQVADHFLGVDSVGQHICKAMDKKATVVIGSTYPINISYPEDKDFDIIDIGAENGRKYSPIRLTMDDCVDRFNDQALEMSKEQVDRVVKSVRKALGKPTKFEGSFTAPQQNTNSCCDTPQTQNQFGQTTGVMPPPKPQSPTPNFTLEKPKVKTKGFKQEISNLLKSEKGSAIKIEQKK